MAESNWVAVISGASRGLGRGIAKALGAKGATVYVTGRTSNAGGALREGEMPLPGTIDEVAAEVTAAGGKGVPVVVDMADDAQVKALFDRVDREQGRLDILVNNAAFIHADMGSPEPFWRRSPDLAHIIDVGLRCHYLASVYGGQLMEKNGRGLIVNVSFYGAARMHDPAYYASKGGLDAMAATMAHDLATINAASVSLWPGLIGTERIETIAAQYPELKNQLPPLESPEYLGRVVAALYSDPDMMSFNGKTLIAAELAEHYGVVETDGSRAPSLRGQFGGPDPRLDALAPTA